MFPGLIIYKAKIVKKLVTRKKCLLCRFLMEVGDTNYRIFLIMTLKYDYRRVYKYP